MVGLPASFYSPLRNSRSKNGEKNTKIMAEAETAGPPKQEEKKAKKKLWRSPFSRSDSKVTSGESIELRGQPGGGDL